MPASRYLLTAIIVVAPLSSLLAAQPPAAEFHRSIQPLLQQRCVQCHGPETQEADLRIDQLDPDLLNGPDAEHWGEVLNQLNEGKMPPEDQPQLTGAELTTATTWLEAELKRAADRRISAGGRQLLRRMSRYEY